MLSQPIMVKSLGLKKRPRVPRVIRLGSDCSGMDAAFWSMAGLRTTFVNKFTSDILKEARMLQEHTSLPTKIYPDMMGRTPSEEPDVDVYVWTPLAKTSASQGRVLALMVSGRQEGWWHGHWASS